jgi:hypothetical protein
VTTSIHDGTPPLRFGLRGDTNNNTHHKHLQGSSVDGQKVCRQNSPVAGRNEGSARMERLKIRYTMGRLWPRKKSAPKTVMATR